MTSTFYSWFELEINYGLLFYPNWELNYYTGNFIFYFLTQIPIFNNIMNYNVKLSTFTKSIMDLYDILYIINDVISLNSFLVYILIDYYFEIILNYTNLNLFIINESINYLTTFVIYDVFSIMIFLDYFYDVFLIINFQTEFIIIYNTMSINLLTNIINILYFFIILVFLLNLLIILNSTFRNNNISIKFNFTLSRFYFYFYNLSKEIRINFELLIQFGFFILFIWIFNLMSYDDLNLEIIELFNLILVYFFLFIIIYLLFKYSFHYFAFLEPTVTEGKSNLFILKQFVRDISNTFALFLRFFLLLFRLNIYDGLDDFLDSYALFFYDFDEDNLLFSSNININDDFNFSNSFDNNNQDKEITLFIFEDLFKNYLLYFFEIIYFFIFILEELFRLSLALYILYLIIFEVHSVNCSYTEDMYIYCKKNN